MDTAPERSGCKSDDLAAIDDSITNLVRQMVLAVAACSSRSPSRSGSPPDG